MTIAPVVRTVQVRAAPDRAFAAFVGGMGRWWPVGKTVGVERHVDIVIEPHAGGRWYEIDAAGVTTPWGKVIEWSPPDRLRLGWQLTSQWTYDPDLLTEVELTFAAHEGGSLVTLVHRDLERFGADAARMAESLGGGWPTMLDRFATFASEPAKEGTRP